MKRKAELFGELLKYIKERDTILQQQVSAGIDKELNSIIYVAQEDIAMLYWLLGRILSEDIEKEING